MEWEISVGGNHIAAECTLASKDVQTKFIKNKLPNKLVIQPLRTEILNYSYWDFKR